MIKGLITTPVGVGFRSAERWALRKGSDLYGQVRPCKSYRGVRSRYEDVDLVIVREATEDLYAGIEYEVGSEDARELTEWPGARGGVLRDEAGISIKPISVEGTRRIRSLRSITRRLGRRKVTSVHKANIMKFTDGLWLQISCEVAEQNSDIEFEDRIVDNLRMQLVQRPEEYDVLVLPNLYGDIVSDLAAGLIGGLGLAPGGNFGTEAAVFEPTHGSAPKYAGQNKVNPMAMMLSGALDARHLDEGDAADRLEGAIADVIAEGKSVTYDMKPSRDDPSAVGTRKSQTRSSRSWGRESDERTPESHGRRSRERRRHVRARARAPRLRRRGRRRHQGGPPGGQGADINQAGAVLGYEPNGFDLP